MTDWYGKYIALKIALNKEECMTSKGLGVMEWDILSTL